MRGSGDSTGQVDRSDVYQTRADGLRALGEGLLPFAVTAATWELFARLGPFPPKLFPSLLTVART